MATFRRFQDISAWQLARRLATLAYELTRKPIFDSDRDLRSQIRRAAVSAPGNIAEGFGRSGNREFRQFLAQAKGSVEEISSHFHMALDQHYITAEEFRQIESLCDETAAALYGLMRYLAKANHPGQKFGRKSSPTE